MFDKADPFPLDIRLRYRHPVCRVSKRSWATLVELQTVVPYHSQRYKKVMEECKKTCVITATDLTFTTRFVTVLCLLKLKAADP